MKKPILSVIIVSYNTKELLLRCLDSLGRESRPDFETIVVDNDSKDGSQEAVKDHFPGVTLVENKENLGFGRANNLALGQSRGEYLFYLNPDAMVTPGCLQVMIDFMETNPKFGLCGTRIVNPDGFVQSSVEYSYPGEQHTQNILGDLKGDIAWVLGASMIARKSLIMELGGFDESFFLYGEEQDLCLRIRKAGFAIGFISEAMVVHLGGASEGDNPPSEVWRKKFKAELVFYEKHYPTQALNAIRRRNLLQAYWRILTLGITMPFSKKKEQDRAKLEKYRTVLEIFS